MDPPTLTSPQLSRPAYPATTKNSHLAYPAAAHNPPSQISRPAYPATAQIHQVRIPPGHNPPSQNSHLAYPANLFY